MRIGRNRLWIAALVLLIAAAGCSPGSQAEQVGDTGDTTDSQPVATATTAPPTESAAAPVEEEATSAPDAGSETESEDAATDEYASSGEDVPEDAPAAQHPDRREGPLPVDGDFYEDSPALISATGRPQLLEFYAEW